jgi:hypothetical protein
MAIITNINPQTFEIQQYNEGDQTIIPSIGVDSSFSLNQGRVESFIYDLTGNLVDYNPNAKYTVAENELGAGLEFASTMFVYPEEEVAGLGVTEGSYNVAYNFLNNELSSSFDQRFSLKEISANRKELRLVTNFLTEDELKELTEQFFPSVILTPEYPDFYVNFGQGNLYIANNCIFDNSNGQYSVLIKLYEALPSSIQEKDTLWVVTEQKDTIAYNVEFEQTPFIVKNTIDLQGPNFSLPINNNIHTSIQLKNLNELNSYSVTSSYNQLQSILQEKGVEINIDYSKFSNFVHFSSAEERVKNFYYKIGLIESASTQLSTQPTGSNIFISSSKNSLEKEITSIIENFDGFEYYLYYSSGSFGSNNYPQPFPKSTTTPPYTLASTGSVGGLAWLASSSLSGSLYDVENLDILSKTIPDYILEDSSNEPYKKFVEMTGQHFDTLFTYAQDITNRYNADNRLDFGISKDLVGEAIKSMGINLYTGNFTSTNLISDLVGINGTGDDAYLIPRSDGQALDQIDDYITASNDPTPLNNVNKEIYKRIYHNLPLLLKKKGSQAGLRALITTFGIPDDVLQIGEFTITGKREEQLLPNSSSIISSSFLGEGFNTSSTIQLPGDTDGSPPSTLLSPEIRVQQHSLIEEKYDRSLHYTEAGFSPQNILNESMSAVVRTKMEEDPGFYIGNFDQFYYGEGNTYSDLRGTITDSYGGTPWNTAAYIRYVKFLDSSLFNMIKDFSPVRSKTSTGVIIKPQLQERNIQRPASMSLETLVFNGSAQTEYYNWNTTQSITRSLGQRQEYISSSGYLGGTGGTFEPYNRVKFSSSVAGQDFLNHDLLTPIDPGFKQVWTEEIIGKNGLNSKVHSNQDEFFNGIFLQTGNTATRSSVISNPDGIIQTDNNPQNPYKKAISFTQYAGLTGKGIISSFLQIIANIASTPKALAISPAYVAFYQDYDSLFFNSNFSSGDSKIKTVLEGNGNTVTLQHSSGRQYTFQILSISTWSGVDAVVEVAVSTEYIQGDRTQFINTDIASGQTFTFLPNWDPFTSNNVELNPGPFLYSDYNPIINNTSDPGLILENYEGIRKSSIFEDADYSGAATNSLNPINLGLLQAGSASKAAVQDSNYSSKHWLTSRYEGNRMTSLDFNSTLVNIVPQDAGIFTTESLDYDFNISGGIGEAEPYNPGPLAT